LTNLISEWPKKLKNKNRRRKGNENRKNKIRNTISYDAEMNKIEFPVAYYKFMWWNNYKERNLVYQIFR